MKPYHNTDFQQQTVLYMCSPALQAGMTLPLYIVRASATCAFTCRIPSGGQLKQAGSKMAAEARKPKESGEEKAAQIRVLIAEDNMINMKVAMGILRRMGYEQVQRCSCLLPEASAGYWPAQHNSSYQWQSDACYGA